MFDHQPYDEIKTQRSTIQRLRDDTTPGTGELLKSTSTALWLSRQFPTWLPLITNMENLQRWKEAEGQIPKWKRILFFKKQKRKPTRTQPTARGSTSGSRWLFIIMIFGIIRAIASLSTTSTPSRSVSSPPSIERPISAASPPDPDILLPKLPPQAGGKLRETRKKCAHTLSAALAQGSGVPFPTPNSNPLLDQEIIGCAADGFWPHGPSFDEMLINATTREKTRQAPSPRT